MPTTTTRTPRGLSRLPEELHDRIAHHLYLSERCGEHHLNWNHVKELVRMTCFHRSLLRSVKARVFRAISIQAAFVDGFQAFSELLRSLQGGPQHAANVQRLAFSIQGSSGKEDIPFAALLREAEATTQLVHRSLVELQLEMPTSWVHSAAKAMQESWPTMKTYFSTPLPRLRVLSLDIMFLAHAPAILTAARSSITDLSVVGRWNWRQYTRGILQEVYQLRTTTFTHSLAVQRLTLVVVSDQDLLGVPTALKVRARVLRVSIYLDRLMTVLANRLEDEAYLPGLKQMEFELTGRPGHTALPLPYAVWDETLARVCLARRVEYEWEDRARYIRR